MELKIEGIEQARIEAKLAREEAKKQALGLVIAERLAGKEKLKAAKIKAKQDLSHQKIKDKMVLARERQQFNEQKAIAYELKYQKEQAKILPQKRTMDFEIK